MKPTQSTSGALHLRLVWQRSSVLCLTCVCASSMRAPITKAASPSHERVARTSTEQDSRNALGDVLVANINWNVVDLLGGVEGTVTLSLSACWANGSSGSFARALMRACISCRNGQIMFNTPYSSCHLHGGTPAGKGLCTARPVICALPAARGAPFGRSHTFARDHSSERSARSQSGRAGAYQARR